MMRKRRRGKMNTPEVIPMCYYGT
ncbi:hypothetical protein Godav_027994 [Gossypium davidsonii]|uniref:Uncharacterized protein n=1 Tax=Gossypium davidsonii TaxID=34287 RepID=A0A7J8RXW1_GOSDV|nr:hypothetical protein [Gossypium davidsonii]